jgi:hypothetical protein
MKAITALLALLFVVNAAQAVLFFCQDSTFDPTQPSFDTLLDFYAERSDFKGLRDYFYDITHNADLGNTTIEADIIDQLKAKLTEQGYDLATYSFTITRSNGDITMDTGLGVNPVIDNHGGRYSLGKVPFSHWATPIVFFIFLIALTRPPQLVYPPAHALQGLRDDRLRLHLRDPHGQAVQVLVASRPDQRPAAVLLLQVEHHGQLGVAPPNLGNMFCAIKTRSPNATVMLGFI